MPNSKYAMSSVSNKNQKIYSLVFSEAVIFVEKADSMLGPPPSPCANRGFRVCGRCSGSPNKFCTCLCKCDNELKTASSQKGQTILFFIKRGFCFSAARKSSFFFNFPSKEKKVYLTIQKKKQKKSKQSFCFSFLFLCTSSSSFSKTNFVGNISKSIFSHFFSGSLT